MIAISTQFPRNSKSKIKFFNFCVGVCKQLSVFFRSYGDRKKRIEDSSAFEHIFVGESRDGAILGFHNWLRFYQLEALGYIDYRGYYVSTNIISGEP